MFLTEGQIRTYLEQCLEISRQTPQGIFPPDIGAIVLDRNGEIIGRGYKTFISGTNMVIHAEREALNQAGNEARGGTLITTLEPCIEIRRNQILKPCTALIQERGIEAVIIGSRDKNFQINGRGKQWLEQRGIKVKIYSRFEELRKQQEALYKGNTHPDSYLNSQRS